MLIFNVPLIILDIIHALMAYEIIEDIKNAWNHQSI